LSTKQNRRQVQPDGGFVLNFVFLALDEQRVAALRKKFCWM
jgi:hypothetical protein